MKRRISKRIIAIVVSLCVAFSIMPLPVSAAEADKVEGDKAGVKESQWLTTGKTFTMTMDSVQNVANISRQTIMNLQAVMRLVMVDRCFGLPLL